MKFFIEDDPDSFIGINKECMFVVDLIQKSPNLPLLDIYLTLHKIKTNLPFDQACYFYVICPSSK